MLVPASIIYLVNHMFNLRASLTKRLLDEFSDLKYFEFQLPRGDVYQGKLIWASPHETNSGSFLKRFIFYFYPRWVNVSYDQDGIHIQIQNGYLDHSSSCDFLFWFFNGWWEAIPLVWIPHSFAEGIDAQYLSRQSLLIPWQEIALATYKKGSTEISTCAGCKLVLVTGKTQMLEEQKAFLTEFKTQGSVHPVYERPQAECSTENKKLDPFWLFKRQNLPYLLGMLILATAAFGYKQVAYILGSLLLIFLFIPFVLSRFRIKRKPQYRLSGFRDNPVVSSSASSPGSSESVAAAVIQQGDLLEQGQISMNTKGEALNSLSTEYRGLLRVIESIKTLQRQQRFVSGDLDQKALGKIKLRVQKMEADFAIKCEAEKAKVLRLSMLAKQSVSMNWAPSVIRDLYEKKMDTEKLIAERPEYKSLLRLFCRLPCQLRRLIGNILLDDCICKIKTANETLAAFQIKNDELHRLLHYEALYSDETRHECVISSSLLRLSEIILKESNELTELLGDYSVGIFNIASQIVESRIAESEKSSNRNSDEVAEVSRRTSSKLSRIMEACDARALERERLAMKPKPLLANISKYDDLCKRASKDISNFESHLRRCAEASEASSAKNPISLGKKMEEFLCLQESFRGFLYRIRRSGENALLSPQHNNMESTAWRMFELAMKSYKLRVASLDKNCSELIDKLTNTDTSASISKGTYKHAEKMMITTLSLLEAVLTHEVWLREDIQFWHSRSHSSCEIKYDQDAIALGSFAAKQIELLDSAIFALELQEDQIRSIKDRLKEAMVLAGIHEPFEDKIVRLKIEPGLKHAPQIEPIEISLYLSKIEPQLKRLTGLLERFESFAFLTGEKDLLAPAQSPTVLDHSPLISNRLQCKETLIELIRTESDLRRITNVLLNSEKEKMELWQRRVLLAEKVGDSFLAHRARKRKNMYEKLVWCLEPQEGIRNSNLPLAFEQARVVVERVEKRCGLVPNEVLEQNSCVFALSLVDRIYFLLENLLTMLDVNDPISNE